VLRRTTVVRRKRFAEEHGEAEPLALAIPGLACGMLVLVFVLYAWCTANVRWAERLARTSREAGASVTVGSDHGDSIAPSSSNTAASSSSGPSAAAVIGGDLWVGGKP